MNHSTPGYDLRGSAEDRRRRRTWLLSPDAGFGGNGRSVPCRHCGTRLTDATLQVDRYPVCGHDGGRYVRGNVVPSCRPCNRTRCDRCTGRNERPSRADLYDPPNEEVYA